MRKVSMIFSLMALSIAFSNVSNGYTEAGRAVATGSRLFCPGSGICFSDGTGKPFESGGFYLIYFAGGSQFGHIYSAKPPRNNGNDEFTFELAGNGYSATQTINKEDSQIEFFSVEGENVYALK